MTGLLAVLSYLALPAVSVLPYIEMALESFTKTYRKNIPGVWFAKERGLENALLSVCTSSCLP